MASQPSRGERADYDTYLERMDASMRQKVALTAAYLLCEGRVADMGMGSGAGSQAVGPLAVSGTAGGGRQSSERATEALGGAGALGGAAGEGSPGAVAPCRPRPRSSCRR